MLELTKSKNENGYHFTISTSEGNLGIYLAGNLDLYWRYMYSGNINAQPILKKFTITKENYYLYSLFEELYENVENCNVFTFNDHHNLSCCSSEDNKRRNFSLKKEQEFNPERLFKNNNIEWHCDDFSYNEASIVYISRKKEDFVVAMEKSKDENMQLTYAVRFRNSGSRYVYFNSLFMNMYISLKEYESDYHQVHMEEYLYQKKYHK